MPGEGRPRRPDGAQPARTTRPDAKRAPDFGAAARAALQPLDGDAGRAPGTPAPAPAAAAPVEPASSQPAAKPRRRRPAAKPSPIRQAVDDDIAQAFEEAPPKSLALPGSVLHLPLPAPELRDEYDQDADDEPERTMRGRAPAVDLAPVLEAWVTPLVGELARVRVELAELRAREQARAQAPRVELAKLLAGILLCFALVAAALVLVIKA